MGDCVFAVATSPDGAHLVAATAAGTLQVWEAASYATLGAGSSSVPVLVFHGGRLGKLYSLAFSNGLLACGGDHGVTMWRWEDVVRHMPGGTEAVVVVEPLRVLQLPASELTRGAFTYNAEVNGVAMVGGQVLGAGGDNVVHVWDAATGLYTGALRGHSDYVHCVVGWNGATVASGGEDGVVKLWDLRHMRETHSVAMHDRWVGALAVNASKRWLACGNGSGNVHMLHLASMVNMVTMPGEHSVQALAFDEWEGNVVVGRASAQLHHFRLDGSLVHRVQTSASSVFAVHTTATSERAGLLFAGGTGGLDVFSDPAIPAHSLTVR